MTINIVEAVLLCFLVAALIRMPAETAAPQGARAAMYLLVVTVLVYVLVTGLVHHR